MGSKEHFVISIAKSLVRILGLGFAGYALWTNYNIVGSIGCIIATGCVAELLGILEELWDKRGVD